MSRSFCGAIINVLDFSHPHVESIFEEGLWGFPENNVNKRRWELLERGCILLLYGKHKGNKGVYLKGVLTEKFVNRNPVRYWREPTGYPLQIRMNIEGSLEKANPVLREELRGLGVRILGAKADRWSLIVFGEGGTYPYSTFRAILDAFDARNIVEMPMDHEGVKRMIHNIGILQGKISEMEVELDNYRLDVAWRRLQRANPYIVFEVHLHGNMEEALTKLKHARDIWNSKPVLVTTGDMVERAYSVASGAFHEILDELRIVTVEDIKELYNRKREYKAVESRLGIS